MSSHHVAKITSREFRGKSIVTFRVVRSPDHENVVLGTGGPSLGFLGEWMPLASESLENETGGLGHAKENFGRVRAVGTIPPGIRRAVSGFGRTNQPDPQLVFTATLDKEIRNFLKHEVTGMWPTHFTRPSPGPVRRAALRRASFPGARHVHAGRLIPASPHKPLPQRTSPDRNGSDELTTVEGRVK